MHPVPSHILCSYPVCTQCDSSCLTLGTQGCVALGITPAYSYCHTGYIPSVIVAVSHLVHTEHWVHTLGAHSKLLSYYLWLFSILHKISKIWTQAKKKSTNFFADDKTKKPRNHETTKPQNHETYRYYTDLEMEWVKPCNRETVKLILISMTKSSKQNHGTTKP